MAKKIEKYLPVDYSDSFSIEVTENRLSPKDIILKVFAHNPAWLRMLYAIRACLVKPFGIETKAIESEELPDTFSIENAYFASPESLLIFLEDLIRGKYGNIFRAKGQLPAGSCWFQFDVADSRYGITGCEPLKTGKAVFIGTDIQRQPIRHVALNKMIQKKITWKKG